MSLQCTSNGFLLRLALGNASLYAGLSWLVYTPIHGWLVLQTCVSPPAATLFQIFEQFFYNRNLSLSPWLPSLSCVFSLSLSLPISLSQSISQSLSVYQFLNLSQYISL